MPGPTQSIDLGAPIGRWTFSSAAPIVALQAHVVEYWEVEGDLAPFRERILPNGCAELMFNLGPSHRMIAGSTTTTWDRAWVSGVHERAITIESDNGTHLVSVRFSPFGMHALLGVAASATLNRVIDASALLGDNVSRVRETLRTARDAAQRFALLEAFLLQARSATRETSASGEPIEPYVRAAAARIDDAHGNVSITSLHRALAVSRKQLTTRFTAAMGMSPKRYANVRRFVWTVAQLRERSQVDWTRLALDAGYADQSHMARHFKRVANASPTTFLRQRSPDNTALLEPQPEAVASS
jgi:AraC-like DNA-binding protein